MESRMFLLLVFLLLLFTDHSQGVPETHEQSSIVKTFTDAPDVGQPLTAAKPINTPRQHNGLCTCKGKRRETVGAGCLCKPTAGRRSKQGKLRTMCQKNKNLKKCSLFLNRRGKNGRKFAPSVPI